MLLFTLCPWLFDHRAFARLKILVRGIWNERYELRAGSAHKREIKNNFVFLPILGIFYPFVSFLGL